MNNNIHEAVGLLQELVKDIEATGGLMANEQGQLEPAGHPEWLDLGVTILKAHEWLVGKGYLSTLSITSSGSNETYYCDRDE